GCLHALRRLDPKQVERASDHSPGRLAQTEAKVLELRSLRSDDAAIPVEDVKVRRHVVTVGGEAMRGSPLSRLAHLFRQLEQTLYQRPLRRLERESET